MEVDAIIKQKVLSKIPESLRKLCFDEIRSKPVN